MKAILRETKTDKIICEIAEGIYEELTEEEFEEVLEFMAIAPEDYENYFISYEK